MTTRYYECLGQLTGGIVGFFRSVPGTETPAHVVTQLRGAAYTKMENMAYTQGSLAVDQEYPVWAGLRQYGVIYMPASEVMRASFDTVH